MVDFNILNSELMLKEGEPTESYIIRLMSFKEKYELSYQDIADIVKEYTGFERSRHYYNRHYDIPHIASDEVTNELNERILELKKEKVKLSEERTQNSAYVRQLAREETLKEMAVEAASIIGGKKFLNTYDGSIKSSSKEAILEISDWHYGIDFNNYWNSYNPEIARKRVSKLTLDTISRCKENGVTTLNMVDLGDMIAGRIHLSLRLESRFDVISQVIQVSEIIAEMISEISSNGIKVNYYSCLDNHSRLEPNKSDAMDLESLQRIIPWYLQERFKNNKNIVIHENLFGEDIISFTCLGHEVLGVHGDKDSNVNAVDKLSLMTEKHYDMILTAHLHHFSADEKNKTLVVSNSSLMGTDSFAKNLRLSANPSQNLIIVSEECVCEILYRILV